MAEKEGEGGMIILSQQVSRASEAVESGGSLGERESVFACADPYCREEFAEEPTACVCGGIEFEEKFHF